MILSNQVKSVFKLSSKLKSYFSISELKQIQYGQTCFFRNSNTYKFSSNQKDNKSGFINQTKIHNQKKQQESYKKSSEFEENPILKQLELDEFKIPHKYKNCSGCGVKLQTQQEDRLGYIEKRVLKDIVDHNNGIDYEIENGEFQIKKSNQFDESDYISRYMIQKGQLDQLKNEQNKKFIEINDLEFLEEIDAKSSQGMSVYQRKQKDLTYRKAICYRCHQLKYQRNLVDQQAQISKKVEKQKINDESEQSDEEGRDEIEQGKLISTKDPAEFLKYAFKQVKRSSTIIFLVDATDLFATLSTSLIEYAFAQNHKIILAVNKIDALPQQNVQQNLIKSIVKKSIQQKFPQSLPLLEEIVLVSAKNGEGMEKISKYIIQTKMEAKQYQHNRYSRNFYVMGYANTGKSSFINALNKVTKRLLKNQKDDKNEKVNQNENKDTNLNKQDEIMIQKLLGVNKEDDEEEAELTTSSIPGTTVSFIKSRNKRLNVDIYDTPGIPNAHQLYHYFSNPNDAKILVIDKKITPKALTLQKDLSVFFGGLVRIDQVQGVDINVASFMSSNVTIHVTKTYKANEVFIKQYNNILVPVLNPDFSQVIFKRHVIDLKFDDKGKCSQDLEIFGLGWLSFTSYNVQRGMTQLFVYLPEGVECQLRDSFYRFDKSLMHNKIKTKTSHSKLVERQKSRNVEKLKVD